MSAKGYGRCEKSDAETPWNDADRGIFINIERFISSLGTGPHHPDRK